MTTAPPLPPAGTQTPQNRKDMAERFLVHAQQELNKGNRLQASEKAWGAVAQSFKALAQERGWAHDVHSHYFRMSEYLDKEYKLDDSYLAVPFGAVNGAHNNFYENVQSTRTIQMTINEARKAVDALEELRSRPPGEYTIENGEERADVEALTGWRFEVGDKRKDGFVNLPEPPSRERGKHYRYKDHYGDDDHPKEGRWTRPPDAPQGGTTGSEASPEQDDATPQRGVSALKTAFQKAKGKVSLGRSGRGLRKRHQATA